MRLKEKVIIITGASGGMGTTVVDEFLKQGAFVVGVDLYIDNNSHENALWIKADLTNLPEIHSLIKQVVERFGRIDGLVNLAGIAQKATSIEEISEVMWDKIFAINTKSTFFTSQAVIPIMKKQQAGSIVNIASISAIRPRPGLSAYIASKGAAISFSQALAIELAKYHIRVNVINPGPANTTMLGQFAADGTNIEEAKEEIFKKSVPLGELIEPIDIAHACIYLCSDETKMVTGAVFNIDGGRGI